jgi:hypothetical protein
MIKAGYYFKGSLPFMKRVVLGGKKDIAKIASKYGRLSGADSQQFWG